MDPSGIVWLVVTVGAIFTAFLKSHAHYIIFSVLTSVLMANLIVTLPKHKRLCSALALGLIALCIFEYNYPYQSLWTLRQITHFGNQTFKVAINFEFDGKPYSMKRTIRCVSDVIPPSSHSDNYSLGPWQWRKHPSLGAFGMAMPSGEAVIASIPAFCDQPSDAPRLPYNYVPLLAIADRAEDPAEILVYVTGSTYQSPTSRLKNVGIEISQPAFGRFSIADGPDDFAFLGLPLYGYYLGKTTEWNSIAYGRLPLMEKPALLAEYAAQEKEIKNQNNEIAKIKAQIATLKTPDSELDRKLIAAKQDLNWKQQRLEVAKNVSAAKFADMSGKSSEPLEIELPVASIYARAQNPEGDIKGSLQGMGLRDKNCGTPPTLNVVHFCKENIIPYRFVDGIWKPALENKGAIILVKRDKSAKDSGLDFEFGNKTFSDVKKTAILDPETKSIYIPLALDFKTYAVDNRWY